MEKNFTLRALKFVGRYMSVIVVLGAYTGKCTDYKIFYAHFYAAFFSVNILLYGRVVSYYRVRFVAQDANDKKAIIPTPRNYLYTKRVKNPIVAK